MHWHYHWAEVDALLRNFATLRDQVSKYHVSLFDAMGIPDEERVPLGRVVSVPPFHLKSSPTVTAQLYSKELTLS